MAHAQKPDFVFRLNGRVHLNRRGGRGVSSVDYWQASCTHQPAGFALLVQASVLQSCDAYWLPTPFYCFPFTSPPVRHRVPSHFKRSLPKYPTQIFSGHKTKGRIIGEQRQHHDTVTNKPKISRSSFSQIWS
jgi:hypothetical protein